MASAVLRLDVVLLVVVTPVIAVLRINGAIPPVALNVDGTKDQEECMGAVAELPKCTEEILLFFINGEATRVGTGCCHAVRTVTRHCWPGMLAAVGLTADQADVLRGYCDAQEVRAADAPAPVPVPRTCTCTTNPGA